MVDICKKKKKRVSIYLMYIQRISSMYLVGAMFNVIAALKYLKT